MNQVNAAVPAVLVLVVAWLVLAAWDRTRLHQQHRQIAALWGNAPGNSRTDAATASRLHDLLGPQADPEVSTLDDRTWSDLDLDAVHHQMDHTVSPIGAQVLYRMLRTQIYDPQALDQRRRLLHLFEHDQELRQGLRLALVELSDPDLAHLCDALWADPPPRPRLEPLIPVLSGGLLLVLVAALFGQAPWTLVFVVGVVNMVFHFMHHKRLSAFPLTHLGSLLGAAARLESACGAVLPKAAAALHPGLAKTVGTRRRLAALQLDDGVGLVQYLRIVFLLDVAIWASAAAAVRQASAELRQLLLAVGEVDALLAVASWLHGAGQMAVPQIQSTVTGATLHQMRHPLLKTPVPASLDVDVTGILVTGSNMSGKTTFLKTVGVNAILVQTVGLAMAERWSLPPMHVVTSIGRADNIIEGRSYYMAEVESVARMVGAAGDGRLHLFLGDEIFRGTNANERIAGAAAVLRHLASHGDLVFAATHDLELAELLEGQYRTFHFCEELTGDGLRFDYLLRPGIGTGHTAIDLLEHAGYPDEVVAEARLLVGEIEKTLPVCGPPYQRQS